METADRPVKGTGGLIKRVNLSRILECLQQEGPLSRVEIAQRTGISLPTVSHLVAELCQRGLVVQLGKGQSVGGRRPVMYAFNAEMAYIIGIDVGGTKIAGGICDLQGRLLVQQKLPTREGDDAFLPARVQQLIRVLIREAGIDEAKVMGIGLGIPGVPDARGDGVDLAPALAGQDSGARRLIHDLRSAFQRPVFADNDVNTILRGEHWMGALKGVRHGVCIAIGTAIGAGLLVNGEVYRGAHGAAGEIGYWLVGSLGPISRAQGFGPFESFAAGPGIVRRALERWGNRPPAGMVPHRSGGGPPAVTAEVVARAAEEGDPVAIEVWKETAEMVGVAVANLCSLLDPEVVVIGGGVSRAPEWLLLEPVRRIVETLVPYPPRLVLSELGETAGILGAVATVLESRRQSISYLHAL